MFDLTTAKFAFLDLETTGLSPWFGDRVCEVGMVLTEGRRVKTHYQQLVNPQRPLSPGAASTNGLHDSHLLGQPLFTEIADEVQGLLRDAIVVCHNAQFDLQFLDSEFRRAGREIQFPNLIDTLFIARDNFKLPSYTLTAIAEEFGIKNPEAHRALADAITDKNVFFAMMDAFKPTPKPLDDFIGIYNSPAWPDEGIRLPATLGEAIYGGKKLHITYVDKDGETTRRWVSPRQVMGLADYLYLRAFCHLRKEERTFRLDRITEILVEV